MVSTRTKRRHDDEAEAPISKKPKRSRGSKSKVDHEAVSTNNEDPSPSLKSHASKVASKVSQHRFLDAPTEHDLRQLLLNDENLRLKVETILKEVKDEKNAVTIRPDDIVATDLYPNTSIREITEQNRLHSPFLRLPPELRQKIYALALGSQWIHVRRNAAGKRCFDISEITQSMLPESDVWTHKQKSPDFGSIRPSSWNSGEHSNTDEYVFDRILERKRTQPTCLARVCRQLHCETSLLPYMWTVFSFHTSPAVTSYINSLYPCQQDVMSRISMNRKVGLYSSNKMIENNLPGFTESFLSISQYDGYGWAMGMGYHMDVFGARLRSMYSHTPPSQKNYSFHRDDQMYLEDPIYGAHAVFETWHGCQNKTADGLEGPVLYMRLDGELLIQRAKSRRPETTASAGAESSPEATPNSGWTPVQALEAFGPGSSDVDWSDDE